MTGTTPQSPPAHEVDPALVHVYVTNVILAAMGCIPSSLRAAALEPFSRPDAARSAREQISQAEDIATAFVPHLMVFSEMIAAAEGNGWEGELLDRARAAHAALTGWSN